MRPAAAGSGGGGGGSEPSATLHIKPTSKRRASGLEKGDPAFPRWDRFNADAHNWLGYAYRNAGDMKRAFAEYEEALRLDPGHKGAHEYVGEAYVIAKDLPKAREHLAALEKLCGRTCPEYKDLEEAIDKAKVGG
jgi:tetratricopeptide (TPR) repeat protein